MVWDISPYKISAKCRRCLFDLNIVQGWIIKYEICAYSCATLITWFNLIPWTMSWEGSRTLKLLFAALLKSDKFCWVVKISLFNKKLQFSPCIAISQILHNPWNPKQLQLVVKYNCFGLLANCNVHFSLLDNSFDVQHQISMSIFMLVVKIDVNIKVAWKWKFWIQSSKFGILFF